MGRKRGWSVEQLKLAVAASTSFRQVLERLGLRAAGGNYAQVRRYALEAQLDTAHFTGYAWRRGSVVPSRPARPLGELLREGVFIQSFKLKKRLLAAGLKAPACEECGWARQTEDGYLPLELDHINGDSSDNRLENLRVLCPNCHSLKPTHRGRKLRGRKNTRVAER
jgi:5-methylcytosine-specific restriction endonuclease McrA